MPSWIDLYTPGESAVQKLARAYRDQAQQSAGEALARANSVRYASIVETAATSYTYADADAGKLLRTTSGTLVTVTLPTAVLGASVQVEQAGIGQVLFLAGASAAIVNRLAHNRTAGRYSRVSAVVVSVGGGTTIWNLAGDTDA